MKADLINLVILCALVSSEGAAQENCNQSFNVKPHNSMTYLNFGAAAGESIATTMSCTSAELMREQMYISGQALDPALLDDIAAFKNKLKELNQALASQRASLNGATSRAQREAALKTLVGFTLTATLVFSSAGCVAGGVPACASAFGAGVGIITLGYSVADTAGSLVMEASNAVAKIDSITAEINALTTKVSAGQSAQYKLRYNSTYTSLCESIRKQCL